MVAVDKTVMIACVVAPNGTVRYVPNDETSINTAIKAWRKEAGGVVLQEHKDANTMGGVVIVRMLSADYFLIDKTFRPCSEFEAETEEPPGG